MIVAAISTPIILVVLGYLYFLELKSSDDLSNKYRELSDQYSRLNEDYLSLVSISSSSSADLKKQAEKIQDANEILEKKIESAQEENEVLEKENKESLDKVKAYNTLLSYFSSVIKKHNGFDGWTNSEYLHAKGLAQATGDSGIVSKTDWAWNRKDIDPITRITGWLDEIVNGINNSLK